MYDTHKPAEASAAAPVRSPALRYRWLAVVGLASSTFLTGIASSSASVALPAIAADLGLSLGQAQWIISTYFLTSVGLMLTVGSVADQVGHRRHFLLGLVVFCSGAVLSGFAPSFAWLLAARLWQGCGTALILSTNVPIVVKMTPPERRGRALGLIGSMAMLGLFVGPSIGGFIVSWLGWPWAMWSTVPPTLLVLVLAWKVVPTDRPVPWPAGFDWPGAVLYFCGMATLVWGLSRLNHSTGVAGLVLGVALLSAFVWVELTRSTPLVNLALLRRRAFTAGLLGQGLYYMGQDIPVFLLPFFLIDVLGRAPAEAGLVLSILPITAAVGSAAGGLFADRFNVASLSTAAMGLSLLGYAWLLRLPFSQSPLEAAAALALLGTGGGIFSAANRLLVNKALHATELGVGNALHNTSRQTGRLIGLALAAMLASGPGGELNLAAPLLLGLVTGVGVAVSALWARRAV